MAFLKGQVDYSSFFFLVSRRGDTLNNTLCISESAPFILVRSEEKFIRKEVMKRIKYDYTFMKNCKFILSLRCEASLI